MAGGGLGTRGAVSGKVGIRSDHGRPQEGHVEEWGHTFKQQEATEGLSRGMI